MLDFKAAIFDLDGTLLDSMWVWKKVDFDFLAKRNLAVPDKYVDGICSLSFKETAEYTIDYFGLNERAEDIMAEWNQMAMDAYSHHVPLKPNAKEYLYYLKEQDIRLGTATALPKELYEPVLKNNRVYDLFDAFSSTDEVSRGKESPDIYLLAAKKLNVRPRDCGVFEDILPGIKSIVSAGMQAYGVYDQYSEQDQEQIRKLSKGYIFDFSELLLMEGDLEEAL